MPKISVIIPAFNVAATIGRAIKSAQDQTLRDIEILVVDDCSTDGTGAAVAALAAEDPRIKSWRLPQNAGCGDARNAAIAQASGEWIALLDGDDWFEPDRLAVMIKAARDFQADAVCDNLKIYDHAAQRIVERTWHGRKGQVTRLTAEMFFRGDTPLKRHPMGYMQPVIRRKFLAERGVRYDAAHRAGEDFIFMAEILLGGARVFIAPGAHYVYVHRISPTTRKISPHSRSGADDGLQMMIRGCDELLRKYGAAMLAGSRRALMRRRRMLESQIMCQEMQDSLRQGRLLAAVRIFVMRPFVLILILNTIAKWVCANIAAGWSRKTA